jgi:hypothetical protein
MGRKFGSLVMDLPDHMTWRDLARSLKLGPRWFLLVDEVQFELHKYHEDGCLWADIWQNALPYL